MVAAVMAVVVSIFGVASLLKVVIVKKSAKLEANKNYRKVWCMHTNKVESGYCICNS